MNKDHKDRGMKKWKGLFMPETIKMLRDLWEDDHKSPRPHLDETKIEEIAAIIGKHQHQNAIRNYHMDKRFFHFTRWICNKN